MGNVVKIKYRGKVVMTVQEYIDRNLPFYHITPSTNRVNILQQGLRACRCDAICTVRSDNHDVWDTIIQSQLGENGVNRYMIIKLTPETHNICVDEVAPDSVEEPTSPLHSYICKNNILITEEDIVCDDYESGRGLKLPTGVIEGLTNYHHAPIPDISVLNIRF